MRQINRKLKLMIVKNYGTQADFAFEIKEQEATVSRVIQGRRNLSTEKQQGWAKALGCKAKDIFSEN